MFWECSKSNRKLTRPNCSGEVVLHHFLDLASELFERKRLGQEMNLFTVIQFAAEGIFSIAGNKMTFKFG
jgi:hypothetical protein